MSLKNRALQYKEWFSMRWIINAVKKAIPKRYCGSCKRAEHSLDGFIYCDYRNRKICPYQNEEWEKKELREK